MIHTILKGIHMPTVVICGFTLYVQDDSMDETIPKYRTLYEPFRLPIDYISASGEVFSLAKSVSDDLELMGTMEAPSMYSYLLSPKHQFGEMMLVEWNKKYTTNVQFLKDTQRVLSDTEYYKDKMHDSTYTMDCPRLMEIWRDVKSNRNFLDVYSYVDFELFKDLNNSAEFLQMVSYINLISPLLSLLIPVIALVLPFLILKIQGIPITFSVYIEVLKDIAKNNFIGKTLMQLEDISWDKVLYILFTTGLYILQIYQNVSMCTRYYKNTAIINGYLLDMRDYITHSIRSMRAFASVHRNNESYVEFCDELVTRADNLAVFEGELKCITPFCKSVSKFNNIGYIMKVYYKLHNSMALEDNIRYSFGFAGFIDNMLGVYNSLAARTVHFATFSPSADLVFTGQYYPPQKDEKYIANDCSFDKNIILSGPNASGKSTLIKTTCLNIIFAQIFGCGFFETCHMVPYERIHTYLNIPDTSGRDSLFQAESRRCKEIIDIIRTSPHQRHFCIFDELFSGTNPVEATKAGYALLTYISKFKTVNFILTTHYTDICERFKKSKRVRNFRMKTLMEKKTDKLTYTYKIRRGVSKVQGAIAVLKEMQFPDEIIRTVKNFR